MGSLFNIRNIDLMITHKFTIEKVLQSFKINCQTFFFFQFQSYSVTKPPPTHKPNAAPSNSLHHPVKAMYVTAFSARYFARLQTHASHWYQTEYDGFSQLFCELLCDIECEVSASPSRGIHHLARAVDIGQHIRIAQPRGLHQIHRAFEQRLQRPLQAHIALQPARRTRLILHQKVSITLSHIKIQPTSKHPQQAAKSTPPNSSPPHP